RSGLHETARMIR
ncbi:hypothetical protein ACJX0J_041654, partial [Zea mays]